ncbi:UGT2A1.2 family protein [Megaselia abdita]
MKLHIVLIAQLLTLTSAYNILVMVPFPGLSHWLFMVRFIDELLERGHHLTVVTSHPREGAMNENYTEVLINPIYDFQSFNSKDIFRTSRQSDFANLKLFWTHGLETTEYALKDKEVKKFISMKNHSFDCFIMEQFFSEAFLMFGHKFNIPTITLSILPNSHHLDNIMGLSTPWSFTPHFILPYDDKMSFKEKTHNAILSLYDVFFRNIRYLPKMQKLVEEHFKGHVEKVPLVSTLEKKVSLVLVNSHRATDGPRPTISGLVNIGGAHIKQPQSLPTDFEEFIKSAEHGVIYFSLGAFLKSSEIPKDRLEIMLKIFGKLKQKVLWKFEDEKMKGLPKNVMVKKWMPQNDILAHKKVALFITHGGRGGVLEGAYWGKPMLCLPLFGDQHTNVERIKRKGLGFTLDFLTFTETELVPQLTFPP